MCLGIDLRLCCLCLQHKLAVLDYSDSHKTYSSGCILYLVTLLKCNEKGKIPAIQMKDVFSLLLFVFLYFVGFGCFQPFLVQYIDLIFLLGNPSELLVASHEFTLPLGSEYFGGILPWCGCFAETGGIAFTEGAILLPCEMLHSEIFPSVFLKVLFVFHCPLAFLPFAPGGPQSHQVLYEVHHKRLFSCKSCCKKLLEGSACISLAEHTGLPQQAT